MILPFPNLSWITSEPTSIFVKSEGLMSFEDELLLILVKFLCGLVKIFFFESGGLEIDVFLLKVFSKLLHAYLKFYD